MAKKQFNTNVATEWFTKDVNGTSQNKTTKVQDSKKEVSQSQVEETSAQEEQETEEVVEEKRTYKKSAKPKAEAKFVLSPARELKSRRTSVLLKTSIYEKIEKLAKNNNTSFNDCLNQILEQVLPE